MEEDRIELTPEGEAPGYPRQLEEEPEEVEREPSDGHPRILLLAAVIVAAAVLGAGWMVSHPRSITFDQTYQAVLLSNGQVYFGRLEGYGTSAPVLREVYYVQTIVNDKKEQQNILLKRGKEWHGPDRMYINPQQIVFVEPVGPTSRVYELIRDLKLQR